MKETLGDLRLTGSGLLRILERFEVCSKADRQKTLAGFDKLETTDKALATLIRLYAKAQTIAERQDDSLWNSDLQLFQKARRDLRLQLMRYRHLMN